MKHILEKIKEYNKIIIHSHIRPDGDAIGSQFGLMYLIKNSFPEKEIYITGDNSEYLSFMGNIEKVEENFFEGALSICLDCGNPDRLSDNRYNLSDYSIKIDHHFDSENYTDYSYVDAKAASTTEIITEFYNNFKDELIMDERCATSLYLGILTDTGRFAHPNVTSKTFKMASHLLENGVDVLDLNNKLGLEIENLVRLKGHILENFKVSKNGFAYFVISKEIINKYNVSEEDASSLITCISNLKECTIWALIIETDTNYRVRLRSRNIAINDIAKKYNGGGHKLASGCFLENLSELDNLIKDIDEILK